MASYKILLKFSIHFFAEPGEAKRRVLGSPMRRQLRLMEAVRELALQPWYESAHFVCSVKARRQHGHIGVSELIARAPRDR
jgi:hypothetical protein